MTKKSFEPNPSLFAEMSRPYKSNAEADEALQGFSKELAELRKKYKIPSMVFSISVTAIGDDGESQEALITGGFGDQMRFEAMAAHLLGKESSERQQRIHKLLAQGIQALERCK